VHLRGSRYLEGCTSHGSKTDFPSGWPAVAGDPQCSLSSYVPIIPAGKFTAWQRETTLCKQVHPSEERCDLELSRWSVSFFKAAITPFGVTLMISKLFVVALATTVVAASPVLAAKSKASGCTNEDMAKADSTVMQMPEGDNKTKAMQEMTAAKSSQSQQDIRGCAAHVNAAMKMTTMKPKKT
jgi:hypothetical protein